MKDKIRQAGSKRSTRRTASQSQNSQPSGDQPKRLIFLNGETGEVFCEMELPAATLNALERAALKEKCSVSEFIKRGVAEKLAAVEQLLFGEIKGTHYCLVENRCYLPLDRKTAKSALTWIRHRGASYRLRRRRTMFGRPAIDILVQRGGAR